MDNFSTLDSITANLLAASSMTASYFMQLSQLLSKLSPWRNCCIIEEGTEGAGKLVNFQTWGL